MKKRRETEGASDNKGLLRVKTMEAAEAKLEDDVDYFQESAKGAINGNVNKSQNQRLISDPDGPSNSQEMTLDEVRNTKKSSIEEQRTKIAFQFQKSR